MVRRSAWRAAFFAVLASAFGVAVSWAILAGTPAAKPASEPKDALSTVGGASAPLQSVKVYFVKGEQFAPVTRQLPMGVPAASGAMEALVAGPNDTEHRRGIDTTIPPATSVAALAVASGEALLELNTPRRAPTADDVSLRPARAAQIVYTLTSLPDIQRVSIHVNGVKRATFIGSELLVGGTLDQQDLSRPVRLTARPISVPVGAAPVDASGVQKRLQELTYLPRGTATGIWDYRTTQAVLAFQGWHGLTRDGIVGPQTVAALEIAKAPRPSSTGGGPRIEVHRDAGVVLLIEGAKVIRTVHASSGAPAFETPAGSYTVFRKEQNSWSIPYQVWLPYASYFNGGIAFHGSDDVPARPVSHGCVRVPGPEAASVYAFATIGTPVLVL